MRHTKDHFLQLNNDNLNCEELHFVFLDSLDVLYDKEDEIGENAASSPISPFKGKSADKCSLLLQQLRRAGADINHEEFVILDERSLRDDTVLVVLKELLVEGKEGCDCSVRMVAEIAQFHLFLWMSGKRDIPGLQCHGPEI